MAMSVTPLLRPDVSLRRGVDRHQTQIGWLHGRHSFDTGIDPLSADTHHGVLVVSNLAQRMTAGTGIRHSEKNDHPGAGPGAGRPLDLVQMWVVPDESEVEPGYEQLELNPSDIQGGLVVVASGMARHRDQAAIRIRNRYAALHVTRLQSGGSITVPDAPFVHVYVARGRVDLEAEGLLDAGDAARLTAAGERRLDAVEPSEVLIWEMHASLAPAGGQ
jgi:quercetin 2,3-dioxygenase